MSNGFKNEETRNAVNEMLSRIENGNAHYGKADASNALACNRLFGDSPVDRCEVWLRATGIDVYVGKETVMFASACNILRSESDILRNNVSVKRSAKEICVTFRSIKALDIFFTRYYAAETTATETKSSKRNSKSKSKSKKESKTA